MPTKPNGTNCPLPNKEEILQQLNRLKTIKLLGGGEVQGKVLKNLDEGTINRIHSIIWHVVFDIKTTFGGLGTALVCGFRKKIIHKNVIIIRI